MCKNAGRIDFCYTFGLNSCNRSPPEGIKFLHLFCQQTPVFLFMTKFLRSFFLQMVCFAALGVISVASQTPKPTPTPEEIVGQIKTFEVRLPVTVSQGKKNLITGLNRNDFIVLEDG